MKTILNIEMSDVFKYEYIIGPFMELTSISLFREVHYDNSMKWEKKQCFTYTYIDIKFSLNKYKKIF